MYASLMVFKVYTYLLIIYVGAVDTHILIFQKKHFSKSHWNFKNQSSIAYGTKNNTATYVSGTTWKVILRSLGVIRVFQYHECFDNWNRGTRFEIKQPGDVHDRIFGEAVTEFRVLRMLTWWYTEIKFSARFNLSWSLWVIWNQFTAEKDRCQHLLHKLGSSETQDGECGNRQTIRLHTI